MNLRTLILPPLLVLAAGPARAGFQVAGKPDVRFQAEGHPGALDIEGVTDRLTLAESGDQLTLTVPLASLDSGIELRDEHMKEQYLEVEKFPDAILRLSTSGIALPQEKGASVKGSVPAAFTIHGVEQPVTVDYTLKRSKEGWQVKSEFTLDASLHGIAIPSYLGITVEPRMTARARFDLVETGG